MLKDLLLFPKLDGRATYSRRHSYFDSKKKNRTFTAFNSYKGGSTRRFAVKTGPSQHLILLEIMFFFNFI
jgi:hypothetical protein